MGVESIWQYSTIHDYICKVIETRTLWGDTIRRFWLPGPDSVVRRRPILSSSRSSYG